MPALKRDLRTLSPEELGDLLRSWGEPAYRAGQVIDWLHRKGAASWDELSNIPARLRQRLDATFAVRTLALVRLQGARDTTRKFLWRLPDGALIESVLIPANPALYGEGSDRHTLCVSSQVGCAYGCNFCASGLEGWKRNLGPEEILEQVLAVERWHRADMRQEAGRGEPGAEAVSAQTETRVPAPGGRLVSNLVIMGMGEPLANYDALLTALRVLNAPWSLGIGARKITISTSGLVPQIRRLAAEPEQFRLAISLHGATDEVRSKIMPINRKYPLAELTAACETYLAEKGKMITLEYILIAGVNDHTDQTRPLAALARRLHAKVNLIPYNAVEGLPWSRPAGETQRTFLQALLDQGISATLRREKGHDIDAACGQLRLRTAREESGGIFPGDARGRSTKSGESFEAARDPAGSA